MSQSLGQWQVQVKEGAPAGQQRLHPLLQGDAAQDIALLAPAPAVTQPHNTSQQEGEGFDLLHVRSHLVIQNVEFFHIWVD